MGFLFVGSVAIIPQWFTTRRSLANGIGSAGSGMFGLAYSLVTEAMIENLGLAWTFRILGIVSFTVNVVCALLIKDRNKQVGTSQLAFDFRLFKRPEFLLLLGFGFFSMLVFRSCRCDTMGYNSISPQVVFSCPYLSVWWS